MEIAEVSRDEPLKSSRKLGAICGMLLRVFADLSALVCITSRVIGGFELEALENRGPSSGLAASPATGEVSFTSLIMSTPPTLLNLLPKLFPPRPKSAVCRSSRAVQEELGKGVEPATFGVLIPRGLCFEGGKDLEPSSEGFLAVSTYLKCHCMPVANWSAKDRRQSESKERSLHLPLSKAHTADRLSHRVRSLFP